MRTAEDAQARPTNMMREIASHTAITFISTLAIQLTTFAILALAALMLPIADFARLSIIVASVMLASALFELGLNITSTKMYGDTRDEGYLRAAFAMRLLLIPVGAALGAAVALSGLTDIGAGIALAAPLNLWNGVRATDQARQDYASFIRSSIVFAVMRGTAGLLALLIIAEPLPIAFAVYALPVAASALSASARLARQAFSAPWPQLSHAYRYAGYVYLNAVTFIAVPYVPQFFVAARLDATAVGTYGLILTFSGPIALVVNSVYNVLLPKMLTPELKVEALLWSRRGFAIIGALWLALMAGGGFFLLAMDQFYSAKFPDLLPLFVLFFSGFSASTLIGIYTLSVHTQGVPKLNAFVNVVRLIILTIAIYWLGQSLSAIVAIMVVVLLLGQLVVVGWLAGRRSYRRPVCAE